jgi:hypothetical protein
MPTIYDALEAFLQEHRRCGDLDTGVDGERVWATCSCGASLVQPLPAEGGPIADPA